MLGDGNSKERMNYLKEILEYLYSLRADLLIKEIAGLREKSIEKENVRICMEIRDRIRAKWGVSRKISLQGNKIETFLSNETKEKLVKL